MKTARWWRPATMMLGATTLLACGNDDGRNPFETAGSSVTLGTNSGTNTVGTTDGATTGDETAADETMGAPKLDIGSADSGQIDTGNECAEVSDTANVGVQPADILVVVDNSGSMTLEAGFVQQNMNAFSSQIFLANIDARVVLISGTDTSFGEAGICLPQPLGSGSCPNDSNLPTFLHIADEVGSSNALLKILEHSATWLPQFRPTAAKHVIVVSDDDSSLSANQFDQMFRALDPSLEDYVFHAIVAPDNPDPLECALPGAQCCDGLIPISADVGQVYIDLINLTGGVFGDLCSQNFAPVFDQVSMEVVSGATLACEYEIPPPPDGMEFNPNQVNVEFDDGSGGILEIGYVDDLAACAGVADGWYYDDPLMPTSIIVCPQTCDQIQGFNNASVSIKFGCATVPAG
ncbi:MAG: VWA domain-containing protein [Myxococcales bacterium]|nr:VWA domain-containing protein [Myxococcales bacterium]